MEKFVGTWRLESSEKFDDYMKVIGVGFLLRKAGNTVKPDLTFLLGEDGACTLKTTSTFKNSELAFKLDEEFEEVTIDGRKVKSSVTVKDDGQLVHQQGSEPPTTIERRIRDDGKMEVLVKAGDVVCTRVYRKLAQ